MHLHQPDTLQWHLARQVILNIEWNRTLQWELNYRVKEREQQMQSVLTCCLLIQEYIQIMLFVCLFQPSYAEFDISGNVLGLIFNQGMIWWITPSMILFSDSFLLHWRFSNEMNSSLISFPLLKHSSRFFDPPIINAAITKSLITLITLFSGWLVWNCIVIFFLFEQCCLICCFS